MFLTRRRRWSAIEVVAPGLVAGFIAGCHLHLRGWNRPCRGDACEDCGYISRHSELTEASCEACQHKRCGAAGCGGFPCVAGRRHIRSCVSDESCAGIAPFCGHHASTHDICQYSDPY
jgi:hypothetical protein